MELSNRNNIIDKVRSLYSRQILLRRYSFLQALLFILISGKPRVVESYLYHTFPRLLPCTSLYEPFEPRSIADLQKTIHFALGSNLTVKAIGSGHSMSDIICTTGIPIKITNINHFSYDPVTTFATVGAGVVMKDLLERLHVHGRALTGIPTIGEVTVAGVLGTGATGISTKYPSTLSGQIVSVTVVDGLGKVRIITDKDEDFKAFRVHLGLLGIIYEVVLRTLPQYKLQVETHAVSDNILWNGKIHELADQNDFLQYWWFPSSRQVVLSIGNHVPVNTTGNCEIHFIPEMSLIEVLGTSVTVEVMQRRRDHIGYYIMQRSSKRGLSRSIPGRTPLYTRVGSKSPCLPVAVGYSHRMMTNTCKSCAWKHEPFARVPLRVTGISVPRTELPGAIETLREILKEYPTEFPFYGIYFRHATSSDGYMVFNEGQQYLNIEWLIIQRFDNSQPIMGLPAYQAMGQALMDKHNGYPHWAVNQLYYFSREVINRTHSQSNLAKFIKVMNKMDPHGVFRNDFGRRIRLESNEMTSLSEEMTSHCALNDVCLCKNDLDCGNGGSKDYTCGDLMGYKVCKEKPSFMDDWKKLASRQLINTMSMQPNVRERILKTFTFNGIFKSERG